MSETAAFGTLRKLIESGARDASPNLVNHRELNSEGYDPLIRQLARGRKPDDRLLQITRRRARV